MEITLKKFFTTKITVVRIFLKKSKLDYIPNAYVLRNTSFNKSIVYEAYVARLINLCGIPSEEFMGDVKARHSTRLQLW